MAGITKEEAQKILESNGYKVLKHLGEGGASHAFKASRRSDKDPTKEKIVAAKVCYPQNNSLVSLGGELRAALELKKLKDDFKKETRQGEDELKKKILEAKKNQNRELVDQMEKGLKELKEKNKKSLEKHFKYLTIPKLKLKYDVPSEDFTKTVAIFEAPLADSNIDSSEMVNGATHKPAIEIKNSTIRWAPKKPVLTGVSIDYNELKRAAKNILKGLRVLHGKGMSHGDIKLQNILKKFDANKGKYKYSLTDFGTLDCIDPSDRRAIKQDFVDVSQVLVSLWQYSLYGHRSPNIESVLADMCRGGTFKVVYKNQSADYTLTADDKAFAEFCKKLYRGDFKSADDALADSWLKK